MSECSSLIQQTNTLFAANSHFVKPRVKMVISFVVLLSKWICAENVRKQEKLFAWKDCFTTCTFHSHSGCFFNTCTHFFKK